MRIPIPGDSARHRRQLPRFLITGGAAAVLDFALIALFVQLVKLPVIAAYGLSSVICLTTMYVIHMSWTFAASGTTHRTAVRGFLATYLTGMVLNMAIATALNTLGMWYLAARAVATIVVTVWNYAWSDAVVFRPGKR